jgi:hypothetical protein
LPRIGYGGGLSSDVVWVEGGPIPALAILAKQNEIRVNDFVFPGSSSPGHVVTNTMLQARQRLGRADLAQHLTQHRFRSCFTGWAAEETDFPSEVRAMALAHKIRSEVEGAYRRGDLFRKRRQLLEAWANCIGAAEVVRFPGNRRDRPAIVPRAGARSGGADRGGRGADHGGAPATL